MKKFLLLILIVVYTGAYSQGLRWDASGSSYLRVEGDELVRYTLPANSKATFLSRADLTPQGYTRSLRIRNYTFSGDQTKLLLFTNTRKV
jgi:dipeptidyl-peptidase-4